MTASKTPDGGNTESLNISASKGLLIGIITLLVGGGGGALLASEVSGGSNPNTINMTDKVSMSDVVATARTEADRVHTDAMKAIQDSRSDSRDELARATDGMTKTINRFETKLDAVTGDVQTLKTDVALLARPNTTVSATRRNK
jgi:hypothetical protein